MNQHQFVKLKKYDPFPKLREAFPDYPNLYWRHFDALQQASKALATEGREAALRVLETSGNRI